MKEGFGFYVFWIHFWGLIWLDWLLDLGYALIANIVLWACIAMSILIVYKQWRKL